MSDRLLNNISYTNSATLSGDKVKGDGHYGMADGLHTVMVDLVDFIGTIKIQGSLETTPSENDWFDTELNRGEYSVDTTGKITELIESHLVYTVAETSINSYNTTGNFVWLRANISNWSAGTIARIELNR